MKRRQLLCGLCAAGVAGPRLAEGQAVGSAEPPSAGDAIAFAFGARAGERLRPDDLAVGAEQVLAYPVDPASGRMRDGSRLNQLIVTRVDSASMTEQTLARAAAGVVAYSGVCSHTGCDVTDWNAAMNRFQCPCHESQFDPADAARVVGGPAPWPLAALPLRLGADGFIEVAGPFEGRVGFMQPGLDPFGGIGGFGN